jgi:hypothetical protein
MKTDRLKSHQSHDDTKTTSTAFAGKAKSLQTSSDQRLNARYFHPTVLSNNLQRSQTTTALQSSLTSSQFTHNISERPIKTSRQRNPPEERTATSQHVTYTSINLRLPQTSTNVSCSPYRSVGGNGIRPSRFSKFPKQKQTHGK